MSPAAWLARHQPVWLEHLRLGAPVWIGPTGELALATAGLWRSESIFMQLITKLDEANTHRGAGFMIMAGYIGRLGEWNRFDRKWGKALRKAELPYFHGKEHYGHPHAPKIVAIPDKFLICGLVTRLDEIDYKKIYKAGKWGGKAQPDSMYGLCFRYTLSAVLDIGLRELRRPDLRLDFIIESGHPNEGAPNEIMRQLRGKKISGVSEFLGTVTPMEKEDCYGLQAADALAYGAAQAESGYPSLINVDGRAELVNLKGLSLQRAPVFRCHIDREEIEKFRDGYFAHIDFRKKFGERKPRPKTPVSEPPLDGQPA
jgi:hypothetical protein